MTIREALGNIATMSSNGNMPGSNRQSTTFTNAVSSMLRNVGVVTERPNGQNGYPTFVLNGVDYQIKTATGNRPMWNEVYVRPDSVLILNLQFGTVIVHGSLITDTELMNQLVYAKDNAARILKELYQPDGEKNFFVAGGRVQFGDNIDWRTSRVSFLSETIDILEELDNERRI